MLTERQLRHATASTLSIVMLFCAPTSTHALSCASRTFTLSEAFEAADSIIVGLITECREETSSDPWASGGDDCSFSSMEVLKEPILARDYSGVSSSSGCGLSLHVGNQYLLFLDEKNQPLHFSAPLSGDRYQVQLTNTYLRILREFRDGVVNDLAEPWVFRGSDGNCSVSQSIGGSQIRFRRRTSDAPQQPKPEWTQETINGSTVYKSSVPFFSVDSKLPAGLAEIIAFGNIPDYPDDALVLSVHLPEVLPAPVRQAALSVGTRTWPLNRVEITLPIPGAPAHTVIDYHAAGDVAEQILSAMAKPSDIVVSTTAVTPNVDAGQPPEVPPPDQDSLVQAHAKGDYFGQALPEASSARPAVTPRVRAAGSFGAQKEPPQHVLRMESRSTQLSGVIQSFRSCYAGTDASLLMHTHGG